MTGRKIRRKFYKGKFLIAFYDKNDEFLEYLFDNVREILVFMKQPLTPRNINLVNVELYKALKSENHMAKFLTGNWLRVYAVPIDDDITQED